MGAERKVSALNTLHGRETKGEEWKSSWHTRVSKSKAKKRREEKSLGCGVVAAQIPLFTARHPRQSRPISAPISPENVFPRAADDMKIATRPPFSRIETAGGEMEGGRVISRQGDGLRIDTALLAPSFFAAACFDGNLYSRR